MLTTPRDRDTVDASSLRGAIELLRGRRIVALAGAGCSTESGIPDYRGSDAELRKRSPIQYGEFVGRAEARTRYWSRSTIGWPRFSAKRPNPAHDALARLEAAGSVRGIITQNVDGLHHAAGSRRVVELHGSLASVRCLDCAGLTSRDRVQERILAMNPGWIERLERRTSRARLASAPDGDAEIPAWALEGFRVPDCGACGGVLKPDVVLFGENVPKDRVDEAWRLFEEGDALLVLGSSLTVYSGRRFVYRAVRDRVPIVVINIGATRADDVAAVKVEARLGHVLPGLAESLMGRKR